MSKQKSFPLAGMRSAYKEMIAHYENQTEDQEFADIEAAREAEDITLDGHPHANWFRRFELAACPQAKCVTETPTVTDRSCDT